MPPMQRRRTQPEFMRELAAEVGGRKKPEKEEVDGAVEKKENGITGREEGSESGSLESGSHSEESLDSVGAIPVPTAPRGRQHKGSLKPRNRPAPGPPGPQTSPPGPQTGPPDPQTAVSRAPPPVAAKPSRKHSGEFG